MSPPHDSMLPYGDSVEHHMLYFHMWKLFQMKMQDDAGQHMQPVCKNELCTTGQELWNYETQSVYGAAGTPASLPFRETFDPEYKQTSPEIPNSPLYITTWNINKCKQNGSGEINHYLSPDISIFIVLFNHPLTQGLEFFAQKPSLQKCENIHRALTPPQEPARKFTPL